MAFAAQKDLLECYDMIRVPAAERNKGPILAVLRELLQSERGLVFEVGSGPGQHVAHFAQHFPNLTFQPSDCDLTFLKSIQAYIKNTQLPNILQPLYIDITHPICEWPEFDRFQPGSYVAVLNINMIHISPWETCQGLMNAASILLRPGGLLYMYGPFAVEGVLVPETNVQYHMMLRERNPAFGVRDIADVREVAAQYGITLEKVVDMPSNNKSLILIKQ